MKKSSLCWRLCHLTTCDHGQLFNILEPQFPVKWAQELNLGPGSVVKIGEMKPVKCLV